jgi:hypothetical protein
LSLSFLSLYSLAIKMTETTVETAETAPKTPDQPAPEENVENGHGEEAPVATETNGTEENKAETPKEEVKEDPPKEMKSVVLMSFGGYKGVKVLKKPEPTPQNGEVLIRVRSW